MTTGRIGFACKLSGFDSKNKVISIPEYNVSTTTITWLNKQHKDVAVAKLWDLMRGNICAIRSLVSKVGTFEQPLRMVRLGSDILPAYTHENWAWFWKQHDVVAFLERQFAEIGRIAREKDVRLSMHPGQFVVLASENPEIVKRSIEEFEYHTDMARWMGFGKQFQDFKINVHISGKKGPDGIIEAISKLSSEARSCLTIENDEISWGIDASIKLADHCALVLDIHHHFINCGEYIAPRDDRFKRIVDSWRGVRPVIHYSVSREDVLVDHCVNTKPNLNMLLESGYKKQKLRAHSDFMWNRAVNKWALEFLDTADIMVESKFKNIASFALYEEAKQLALI